MPSPYPLSLPALALDSDAAGEAFAAEEYENESGFWFDENTNWAWGSDDIVDLVGDVLLVSRRRNLYGPDVDLQWAFCGDADGIADLRVGFDIPGTSAVLMTHPVEMRGLFAEHTEKTGVPLVVGIYTSIGQYLSGALASLRG